MDWSIIEGRWHEYKAGARQQWHKLTEAQLIGTLGNREHLVGRVQQAYAVSREEAERQVADWQARQFDRLARAANSG